MGSLMSSTINASTASGGGVITTADASGILQLQTAGVTGLTIDASQNVTFAKSILTSGTAQASTSGTSIDFTGIPSWVKRITVMLGNVSLSGSSNILIQIGSGSVTSSGYTSASTIAGSTNNAAGLSSTAGYIVAIGSGAVNIYSGIATISLLSGTTWIKAGSGALTNNTFGACGGGLSPTLSGALDRVRITTVNGTDTFDAGSINIMYE